MINYGKQTLKENDLKAVIKALRKNFLTSGPGIEKFEKDLIKKFGGKFCSVVNNGTSALNIVGKGEEYSFSDNVVLTRVETAKKKEMKLFTDQLDILPNINIILTKKPVKIIQEPSIEIYGVGMKYDNKEGILKLLNNVRVHYDNPRKKSKIN